MKKSADCVVGLRQGNYQSGVGLFNRLLADRLGVPYRLLDEYDFRADAHPLFSFKFEELDAGQRAAVLRFVSTRHAIHQYSLYLHTLDGSAEEVSAVARAAVVFCGNDAIHTTLASRRQAASLVSAFAPSLIPEDYAERCRPRSLALFTFGMAAKVDQPRFLRLRDLLAEARLHCQLICSLAVHQTSDGRCLEQAVEFFETTFGDSFVFLGTLGDMGVAYFLNSVPIFVGFYKDGVRRNNTTFNTALCYSRRIITNLDAGSPVELGRRPTILNLDEATPLRLKRFLTKTATPAKELRDLHRWDELIHRMQEAWRPAAERRVA